MQELEALTGDHEVHRILLEVAAELVKARAKFPPGRGNPNLAALMEEVGELSQAVLHIREGKVPSNRTGVRRVREEAVQAAVMALRVALEGSPEAYGVIYPWPSTGA